MSQTSTAPLPAALRRNLEADSLAGLWQALRTRLERTGLAIRGTLDAELNDDAAERLSGILGRPVGAGTVRLRLADLDNALRRNSGASGLVAVLGSLTGSPLRDRAAEQEPREPDWKDVWRTLDVALLQAGLSGARWVTGWTDWLHRSGLMSRLGAAAAERAITDAVRTLAELGGLGPDPNGAGITRTSATTRSLTELASRCTGSPHGLDDGRPAAALVLRATAIALDRVPPVSTADRRHLWQRLGVSTDSVSATVLTWGLRPPGRDRWSAMMRERAELGLVTHLTMHELNARDVAVVAGDAAVYACESPQVLQAAAQAAVHQPVICIAGRPTAAGMLLFSRLTVRYHGDFDWAGIATARRVFALGARPWRMACTDYSAAVERIRGAPTLPLTGSAEPTPWDPDLVTAMSNTNVAVHEDAVVDVLLADLDW